MERKLTAILSADVKGYSRLMGDNEAATIRTLTAYREVMTTLIQRHRGRVVDSPGDNLLAEFASAVDALQGVIILAAVQQVNVVVLAHAVKFHASVSTDRRVRCRRIDLARSTRSKRRKLINSSAVYRQLRDLRASDDVADFAGVCLHANRVSLDCDGFRGTSQHHLKVHSGTIADLQIQALLFGYLKSVGFSPNIVVAKSQFQVILAGVIGRCSANQIRFGAGDGDGDVCNGGTRWVSDSTHNGGILRGRARSKPG
jgi:hypothetical protein